MNVDGIMLTNTALAKYCFYLYACDGGHDYDDDDDDGGMDDDGDHDVMSTGITRILRPGFSGWQYNYSRSLKVGNPVASILKRNI